MTNDELKQQLQSLITDESNKEMIEKVAVISNKVDEIIAHSVEQDTEYKELLKDYASVIKNSTFKVDNHTMVDEGKKTVTFEDFAKDWQSGKSK